MDFQLLYSSYRNTYPKWSSQKVLYQALKEAIQTARLSPATRLLSSRALASELGIARNTVIYVYEQLAAEGYILSQRQGSIVNPAAQALQHKLSSTILPRELARLACHAVDWPVASSLSTAFAPGVPALDEFPIPGWRKLLEQCWREAGVNELGYADALGDLGLRQAIAEYLRISRGVQCQAQQVVITDGTQTSLVICAQALAAAGDKVWMENPGYTGAQIAFRSAQLKILGINVDEFGIVPEAKDWQLHKPKLVYVTPSHQYPTGGVLPFARRLELLQQAQRHGSLLIEDDYDSEFRHAGPALNAMQGMMNDAPVVYLGTFSKTMFPALRLAFMVVPESCIASVSLYLQRTALRGRVVEQKCLARFIREGHFASHLRRMRRLYKRRRDVLQSALREQLDGWGQILGDAAGMHLILRFPQNDNQAQLVDSEVSQAAMALGIVAPAISAHKLGRRKNPWNGLMLGYAQVEEQAIPSQVKRLVQLLKKAS